jgi:DNA mismatch repair protein MutS
MKQYAELKEQAGDALLFFRMGDFYELFGDDAVEAAKILEITLTSRDKNKPDPLPMAGVPHHSAGNYVQKLLNAGKKVAICEQFEEVAAGKPGKTLVRRAIVQIGRAHV